MKAKYFCLAVILSCLSGCARDSSEKISRKVTQSSDETLSCGAKSQKDLRTVGIVPQFPPAQIMEVYTPIFDKIGSITDLCFQIVMSKNIPDFEENLISETHDYAFMNPYHQVMVKDKYIPIIRDRSRLLTGIIVTHKQSDIKTIDDLSGRRMFLPAPNAFGASLLTKELLKRNKITPEIIYVNTHPNVYRNVFFDHSSAGGGVNNTLIKEQDSLKSHLRVLSETEGFAAHPFSGSSRLSETELTSVALAFKQLSKDPQYKETLRKAQLSNPIDTNYQKDYQVLEKLHLEEFIDLNTKERESKK